MSLPVLVEVESPELKFHFQPRKQSSCSLRLKNKTDNHVAFKVKLTNPGRYYVKPSSGIILPESTFDVIVTSLARREFSQGDDKFLIQSVVASPGATRKDISPEMFNKDLGHLVEECKLGVVNVAPLEPLSLIPDVPEEGSSSRPHILRLMAEANNAIKESNKLHRELVLLKREGNKSNGSVSYLFVIVVGVLGLVLGLLLKNSTNSWINVGHTGGQTNL